MPKQAKAVVAFLLVFVCGCASNYNLTQQIAEIAQKHNVTITVNSSSNQRGASELLARIDKDLEICPQYFKDNIGPVFIEDSFDEIGSRGMFLIGYVDEADFWNDHPIHIKNRSVLDKILFPTPRENDVFLHEASHSFEFNIKAEISNNWDRFYEEFSQAQTRKYDEGALYVLALAPLTLRPTSMPSLYGSANHFEDFAETHCYLRRNNIELIKDKDPTLYKKCRIVARFIDSGNPAGETELVTANTIEVAYLKHE